MSKKKHKQSQPIAYMHTCSTQDGGCGKTYTTADPIPNFCPVCVTTRRAFYAEIEKRVGSKPKKEIKSDLQIYNEMCKASGTKFPQA